MRDLEVARMLIEPGHAFQKKTIVICGSHEKGLSLSRLRKFGQVLPIGVDGLAAELHGSDSMSISAVDSPQFITVDQMPVAAKEVNGDDFVRLILTGEFKPEKYHAQLQGAADASEFYSIRRNSALNAIINRPTSGINRFVISSDLGNGKTVFIEQLAAELISSGYRVIRVASRLNEVFAELDQVLANVQPTAFLIDDVIRYRVAAQYIGARLNSMSVLVCCMRGGPEEVLHQQLTASLGGTPKQIDLNCMSMEDLQNWDSALERWGLWEEKIELSREERIDFLKNKCSGENRSIVLSLFRTSNLSRRIDQIVSFFIKSGNHKRTFAALLTSSLCQQHVSWESLVSWLDIDEQDLRRDIATSEIADLFGGGRNWNWFTSAQLAEYILRTKYVAEDKDTLVEVFSTIVLCTAESATDSVLGAIFRENLKELVKFRFMTRLLGDDSTSMTLINRVYTRLAKSRLIRGNPQFWLQYAMSRMEVGDISGAETYLNTAYGLAKERGQSYSPFQILDQRSRLYFKKNTGLSTTFNVSEIRQAVGDLDNLLDDPESEIIYLFRSTPFIRDFVDDRIDDLDADIKASILVLLNRIKAAGEGYKNLPRSQKGETAKLRKALSDAVLTLQYG